MMLEQLVDTRVETAKPPFVRRENLVDVEVTDTAKRVEKVRERVDGLLHVDRDARTDARQHVVAAEEQATGAIMEADVAR
jgi:hypothetical protein